MNSQDGSPIDVTAVGVRKPRSGSVRKPRSGGHSVVTFDQDNVVSPLGGSPAGLSFGNEDANSARDSNYTVTHSGDTSFVATHAENVSFSLKDAGDHWIHSHSARMEGEERTELRMFQRRERKRDDDKVYARDASRSGSKNWKDPYAPDKSLRREEPRRAGSPSFEATKKAKDMSERSDRPWREKSERPYKEGVHRDRDGYGSSASRHKSKGSDDRERNDYSRMDRDHKERSDYSMSDRSQRDRVGPSYTGHKDWKSKPHPRDKEYERGDRVVDSKDVLYKSRSVNVALDVTDRHSDQHMYGGSGPHRTDRSSHGHDNEIPSLHRHPPSGESSHTDQSQSDNFFKSKGGASSNSLFPEARGTDKCVATGSSFHEARGTEKCVETSNLPAARDSRSIPKLKLKVGGITHTFTSDGKRHPEGVDTVLQTPHQIGTYHKKRSFSSAPESTKRRQRLILREDSEEDDVPPNSKEQPQVSDEDRLFAYLAEEPGYRQESEVAMHDNNQNVHGVRKSSRIPKKRVFDGDDDIDVEPKRRRKKKIDVDSDEDLYRIEEDEMDHVFAEEEEEEMEMVNDVKLKFARRKRKSLDSDLSIVDDRRQLSSVGKMYSVSDSRGCVPLTARQRALQSSKEGLVDASSSLVEFPEGLNHSAPKKQKEVLSAAERQLKKEEAAQKRKEQVEKAAKEIQAVAIQKILCQDSQRKKREGKLQKQREEMEQEKKAAAMAPASNSIRWTLGPQGTVVSFSQDLDLPNIFSGPLSYPQERERCAGPSCTNAYKYRDSKTLLPLCSLQCYRAVQKKPSEAGLAH